MLSIFTDLVVFTDRQVHKNQKHISSSARCHSRSSHKHPRKCTNSKHIPACYLPTSSQFTQTARQMYKLQTHFNMLPSKIFASSIRDAQLRLKKANESYGTLLLQSQSPTMKHYINSPTRIKSILVIEHFVRYLESVFVLNTAMVWGTYCTIRPTYCI